MRFLPRTVAPLRLLPTRSYAAVDVVPVEKQAVTGLPRSDKNVAAPRLPVVDDPKSDDDKTEQQRHRGQEVEQALTQRMAFYMEELIVRGRNPQLRFESFAFGATGARNPQLRSDAAHLRYAAECVTFYVAWATSP